MKPGVGSEPPDVVLIHFTGAALRTWMWLHVCPPFSELKKCPRGATLVEAPVAAGRWWPTG